jgi:hypothetical protein
MKLKAIALATLLAFGGAAFAQTSTTPNSPAGSAAQDQVKADKDQLKQDKQKRKADKKAGDQAAVAADKDQIKADKQKLKSDKKAAKQAKKQKKNNGTPSS